MQRTAMAGNLRATRAIVAGALATLLLFAGAVERTFADEATKASGEAKPELVKSGTVKIDQVQAAFMLSGNFGGGTLSFEGKTYEFTIGGLGVGGIGFSKIEATGTVYNMKSRADFVGLYGQARYGFAAGEESGGKLWLENTNGVYIELAAKREGLALSLGADGVYIDFD
ncbi:MAG: hypothetical protein AB7P52_15145 [Alphaproteobacteria bacterium]